MDEPLSNLDAKLRIELREEIRDIQKQVGIATIYVTHDQEEALAISDRICVMSAGKIEQIGTPQEIYGDPQTRFVAGFVGTLNTLVPGAETDRLVSALGLVPAANTIWAARPENIGLAGDGMAGEPLAGTVKKFTYLGREAHLQVTTPVGDIVAQISNPSRTAVLEAGSPATVIVPRDCLMAFDASGRRVTGR
jgi:iron(III) transport system ATP-binding protein